MRLISALFVEHVEFRQVAGGSTRIDVDGIFFSVPVEAYPTTLDPHLLVLVHVPAGGDGAGTLETVFVRDGEELARNVQHFTVEPGRFGYRLVRGELELAGPGTVEATCTVLETGSSITVPLTALPA